MPWQIILCVVLIFVSHLEASDLVAEKKQTLSEIQSEIKENKEQLKPKKERKKNVEKKCRNGIILNLFDSQFSKSCSLLKKLSSGPAKIEGCVLNLCKSIVEPLLPEPPISTHISNYFFLQYSNRRKETKRIP